MPQKPKHIMELIPKFRKIVEDLERIKKYVVMESNISYTSQDARMVALDSLQISISAVSMWIQCCNSLANFHTKQETFEETGFLKSVGSGVNKEQTEMIMFDHLRLGFMTLIHFKIDNVFHNILKHLNALPKKTGYWYLTDEILSQCSFSKKGAEKDILTAFANLRNSLHGNGIHRTRDLMLKIDQKEFNFIKDSRVECASWEHIVILLEANVKILKKIIQSDKVKKKDVVPSFC
ncbi:MAG: hypothetical protein DDT23_00942 [candidate division WS2 bacterium]|nr:hypothetical protein [Candidatus Lithacetigena glycinireducens]